MLLLGNCFWRKGFEAAFGPDRMGEKGGCYASAVSLKDGGSLYGRIIYKNEKEIAVAPNPYNLGELVKKSAESVKSIEPSQISMMPPGMIASMNKDELRDLMAYLISGGNKKHAVFQNK
tara:strand:- start:191 stop:547 length:357 start_codon:yes stop_codon:yes gene_type:complete